MFLFDLLNMNKKNFKFFLWCIFWRIYFLKIEVNSYSYTKLHKFIFFEISKPWGVIMNHTLVFAKSNALAKVIVYKSCDELNIFSYLLGGATRVQSTHADLTVCIYFLFLVIFYLLSLYWTAAFFWLVFYVDNSFLDWFSVLVSLLTLIELTRIPIYLI